MILDGCSDQAEDGDRNEGRGKGGDRPTPRHDGLRSRHSDRARLREADMQADTHGARAPIVPRDRLEGSVSSFPA